MTKNAYSKEYDALRHHVGHAIGINAVWSWATNREESIEIRCLEKGCEDCEPLFEADITVMSPEEN